MNTRILFIDDELDCLDLLKASVSPKAEQWHLEFSNHPQHSLESIKASPPAIVVCDFRMPQMDGIAFLKAVAEAAPEVQRFIMAGDGDKAELEPSIGSAFSFLPKPCPAEQLIGELQRSLAIESWLGNDRIKRVIGQSAEFQSLPPLYLKVVNALNSSNACAEKVGQAIASDIAISAKLLQVVNSSYFGFEEKVSDIVQAVGILGMDAVKNLVLAIQVFGKAGTTPEQKAVADLIWHHSMSVANAAKRIARYETGDDRAAEEAYTAGLFHDIGKLILMSAAAEDYAKARETARSENIPQWQAENDALGCNHAEVGAYVMGRWSLPVSVVECAALHHQPSASHASDFSTLAAVHAANALVWGRHHGKAPHPSSTPDEAFLAEIGHADSWEEWREVVAGKRIQKKTSLPKSAGTDPLVRSKSNSGRPAASARAVPKWSYALAGMAAAGAIAVLLIPSPSEPETSAASVAAPVPARPEIADTSLLIEPSERLVDTRQETRFAVASEPALEVEPEPSDARSVEDAIAAAETIDSFPSIRLTGIFFNASAPVASLNGKLRRVGDSVSGARITEIEPKAVTVVFNGESRTLRLK